MVGRLSDSLVDAGMSRVVAQLAISAGSVKSNQAETSLAPFW